MSRLQRLYYFDWEPPSLSEPDIVSFIAGVQSAGGFRQVCFTIDLALLAARTSDLERLHDILTRRHAGLDDRDSLLRSIKWMLSISLEQSAPHLSSQRAQAHSAAMVAFAQNR